MSLGANTSLQKMAMPQTDLKALDSTNEEKDVDSPRDPSLSRVYSSRNNLQSSSARFVDLCARLSYC